MRTFAHNWDDTRKDMVDNIATLAESASAAAETFDRLESELAASIQGQDR